MAIEADDVDDHVGGARTIWGSDECRRSGSLMKVAEGVAAPVSHHTRNGVPLMSYPSTSR